LPLVGAALRLLNYAISGIRLKSRKVLQMTTSGTPKRLFAAADHDRLLVLDLMDPITVTSLLHFAHLLSR
jgi:hypothetical protein